MKKPVIYVLAAFCVAVGLYFLAFKPSGNAVPVETADALAGDSVDSADLAVLLRTEPEDDGYQPLREELKSMMMNIWAEGVEGGNDLALFRKYCSQDFCDTYGRYENFLDGGCGSLDYSVWVQAQDVEDFSYEVYRVLVCDDETVVVFMTLTNFGRPQHLKVALKKENDRWVIDDFINDRHSAKQLMQSDMDR